MRKTLLGLVTATGILLTAAPAGAAGLWAALPVSGGPSSVSAGPDVLSAKVQLEGTLRVTVKDTVPGAPGLSDADTYDQVLQVGSKVYDLEGKQGTPNTTVRVSGQLTGSTLKAEAVTPLGAAPSAVATTGTSRVLVMLANWSAPDAVTQASAASQIFTDDNNWYRDASYGATSLAGSVTPWMTIAGPAGGACYADRNAIMTQAKNAAVARGYNLASYDKYMMYFPNNSWQTGEDCSSFGGWAQLGASDLWINGYMDRRVTVHELGHNFGLSHSHSYLCTGGLTVGCSYVEYGDAYDAMGNSDYVAHFSGPQKNMLGWMTGRTQDLSSGGTTTLVPMARDAVGTQAVSVTGSISRVYWAEYRQPVDFDSALPTAATNGVQIRVHDGAIGGMAGTGPSLLDARPADGASIDTATLRAGESWTSPEGNRFAVGAVTAAGAALTVTKIALPCPDAAFEPDNTPATAKTQAMYTVANRALCTANDEDWVKFSLNAGTHYIFDTRNLSDRMDTVLSVYNSTGTTVLATNDDFAGTTASQVDYTPTVSGTYLLMAKNFDGSSEGASSTYSIGAAEDTNPVVSSVLPVNDATGVAPSTNVTVNFNESVQALSTFNFSLTNTTSGAATSATLSQGATASQWILNPDSDLIAGNRYTATISGAPRGPRDLGDNFFLSTYSWSFVAGGGDIVAPTITARTPGVNATSVATNGVVSVTFSEPVTGVGGASFVVKNNATGNVKTGTIARVGTTNQWTHTPSSSYYADTRYTVTLTGGASGIRDAAGNPLATTSWTFTTGPAPGIAARTPGVNATGVAKAANLTVTFSEPVSGVSNTTFTVKNITSGWVKPSVVTRVSTTNQWMLNPGEDFIAGTKYEITLTGGATAIRDAGGNPLATTSWTFTTA